MIVVVAVLVVIVAVLVVVGGGGVAMMKRWFKNGKAKKNPHPPIIQKLGMAIDMNPANTPPPPPSYTPLVFYFETLY